MNKFAAIVCGVAVALATGASADDAKRLSLHDGYWVAKMNPPGLGPRITVINDMHVDPETMRVTVYAQARTFGRVISPPQVGPGECVEKFGGDTFCFHPDAVYLNGSGQELDKADGDGAWWVKHSWILGGEGYCNTELAPKDVYAECQPVLGTLLEDKLTMKIGWQPDASANVGEGYNLRVPIIDGDEVRYRVTRFQPDEGNPLGEPVEQWVLDWECRNEESAFDGVARGCPTPIQ